MNKKILIIIIAVILIIALGVGGYFYWNKKSKIENALNRASDALQKLTESVTKGVLPSIQTNPLENKPDINPADKANPFKNIKINPFE
ncbi:MAG: hypothetical protein Q8Q86_03340 [Candidatus Daviesbacteria bacterium]|nr:hypothetical protein [Candidatus Daviesbacteria bacterium]